MTTQASGVVRGLRDAGLPVSVLGGSRDRNADTARWDSVLANTAVAATNSVTVASSYAVTGLERRIVVMMSARDQRDDDKGHSDVDVDAQDRVDAISRCTTHLITVTVPTGP